jgi:hypothetical protein
MMQDADELQDIPEQAEEESMGSMMLASCAPRMKDAGVAHGKAFGARAREESKKEAAKKKPAETGLFGKWSDKMSAGLFKASKMNKNQFNK